ncbi:hypothetical protein BC826DRAFT_1013059 [Russula brevipes]|nr:hypothetical protein BC826DRAFT_1013059 [Russula brevipes]
MAPNNVLRPEDIKRFPRGDPRQDYITLQWLKKPQHYDPASLASPQMGGVFPGVGVFPGANVDALFQGEGGSLPSPVILDYAYGACWERWRPEIINNYRNDHYATIPPLPPTPPDDTDDTDDESEMAKAMDELNVLLMTIVGTTPEAVAERRQKEIEQWERAAQKASRSRVMEWRRKHLDL